MSRVQFLDRLKYVSATSIANYVNNNGLSDWLLMYGPSMGFKTTKSNFMDLLARKGKDYEWSEVIRIRHIVGDSNFKTVCQTPHDLYNKNSHILTEKYMKQLIPVIFQGAIRNELESLIGIPDFIIRSDYIEKLFNIKPYKIKNSSSTLAHNYIYYIVDIKSKGIKCIGKENRISNSGNFKAYKSQIAVYNICLRFLQGFMPSEAFMSTPKGTGKICLLDKDSHFFNIVKESRDWIQSLRIYGSNWNPLKIKETVPRKYWSAMMPNLKVNHEQTQESKYTIAKLTNSLFLLPFCGIRQIEEALKHDIISYKDKNCNSKLLGFRNDRAELVDNIITINTGINKISYKKLTKTNSNFFLDMEFIHSSCVDFKHGIHPFQGTIVYHIGVTWNGGHKEFIADDLTYNSEKNIFLDMITFFSEVLNEKSVVYHWSNAENTHFIRAADMYNLDLSFIQLKDLCKICKEQKLFVKDCFCYGLKPLATSLYKHGFIKDIWDITSADKSQTVGACMVNISNCYNKAHYIGCNILDINEYNAIRLYNKYDCYVMKQIYNLLIN